MSVKKNNTDVCLKKTNNEKKTDVCLKKKKKTIQTGGKSLKNGELVKGEMALNEIARVPERPGI